MWRFTYSVYSYTRGTIFDEWNNLFRHSNKTVELNSSGLNQIRYFECLLSCPCFFSPPFPLWLIYCSLMTLWALCVNGSSTRQGCWTSGGRKAFPLERKINLCIVKEISKDSLGKGQVPAQRGQVWCRLTYLARMVRYYKSPLGVFSLLLPVDVVCNWL